MIQYIYRVEQQISSLLRNFSPSKPTNHTIKTLKINFNVMFYKNYSRITEQ